MTLECSEKALYQPSSLSECIDLLSRPLAGDHFLRHAEERLNQITINDVILGVGTEQISDNKNRVDLSVSFLGDFLDEIVGKNVGRVGFPLIKMLVNLEVEADDDGVPIESAETRMCSLIGRILVRCDQVSMNIKDVESFCCDLLDDNEQLVYHKYKLLKALTSGFKEICDTREGKGKEVLAVVRQDDHFSITKLRNRFTETFSRTLIRTLNTKLGNSDQWGYVLFPEIIASQIVVASLCKDWNSLEIPINNLCRHIEKNSMIKEDLVQCVLSLLLSHGSVFPLFVSDVDNRNLLLRVLKRIGCAEIKDELKTVTSQLQSLLEETDPF